MPRDIQGRYFSDRYQRARSVSRMTRVVYERSRLSTRGNPQPYPSFTSLIDRVDRNDGDLWWNDDFQAVHLRDFVGAARMQAIRRLEIRRDGGRRNFDPVLERLLTEGLFDRQAPDPPQTAEEMGMGFAASMGTRLLVRIESLEDEVRRQPIIVIIFGLTCVSIRSHRRRGQ